MSVTLDFSGKLDFSEIDLTAPNKVVEEILKQLPDSTHGIVSGAITEYNGHVVSYTTTRTSIAEALGTISSEKTVDIQKSLGKMGEESKKYECYLYTPGYTKYRYRLFFMRYGIANYPVQFTLENSIAQSIEGIGSGYIFVCNKREEVETLVFKILTCKKTISVMQELIRINQAKAEPVDAEAAVGENDTVD